MKRTLRSRVINLIDDNLKFRCQKLFQHHQTCKNIETRYKEENRKKFLNRMTQSQFKKDAALPMHFSKYNESEYVPNLKLEKF